MHALTRTNQVPARDAATLWGEFPLLALAYGDFQDYEENLRIARSTGMDDAMAWLKTKVGAARLDLARAQERVAFSTRPISAIDRPTSMSARRGNRLILWLYGPTYFSCDQLLAALAANKDVDGIILRVDSPGGNLHAGLDLAAALRNHHARKLAIIDRSCWSAAVLPTLACDRIYMRRNASMLVHRSSCAAAGNADALADALRTCRQNDDLIIRAIVGSRKQVCPPQGLFALQSLEHFMSSAEALQWGFVDSIIAPLPPIDSTSAKTLSGLDEATPPNA